MHTCTRCGQSKPLAEFSLYPGGRPKSWCKPCHAENARAWYHANKERARAARKGWYEANREYANARQTAYKRARPRQYKAYRLKQFGLTIEDWDRMLEEQGDVCAICKQPPSGKGRSNTSLHVDHCHTTEKVRGLLCNPCNAALGLLKEDPKVIRSLLRYVKERC